MTHDQATIQYLLSLKSLNNFYVADFLIAMKNFFLSHQNFTLGDAQKASAARGVDKEEFDKLTKKFIPSMKKNGQPKSAGRLYKPI